MAQPWVRERRDDGVAMVEVLVVAVLVVSMVGMAVPFTTQAADAIEARNAAGFLAGRIRAARQQAVAQNHAVAVVFDQRQGEWAFRLCTDGNDNGVRRADIASGRDVCETEPQRVSDVFPGIRLALAPHVPEIDGGTGPSEGVRFGTAAMSSCSAIGHCSPGTLYLRSAHGQQFAVRVAGVTGRTRVLRFDSGQRRWAEA